MKTPDASIYLTLDIRDSLLKQLQFLFEVGDKEAVRYENYLNNRNQKGAWMFHIYDLLTNKKIPKINGIAKYLFILDRVIFFLESYYSLVKDKEVLSLLVKILYENTEQSEYFKNPRVKYFQASVADEFTEKYYKYEEELVLLNEESFLKPFQQGKILSYKELKSLYENDKYHYNKLEKYYKDNKRVYYYNDFILLHKKILEENERSKKTNLILHIIVFAAVICIITFFMWLNYK